MLDTTVLIDVSRGREPATSWLAVETERSTQISVSAVTIAEFFTGLGSHQRSQWTEFFFTLTQWDVTSQIARRAGMFRYDLARQGRSLALADALIAATAAEFGVSLVTNNVKDFTWLPLEVISPGD
ncbi:MAG: PIN domain-containing protein [Thermomicrobiales bacterium]